MTWVKRRNGWRLSCDVGEVTESLEFEQRMSCDVGKATEWLEIEL